MGWAYWSILRQFAFSEQILVANEISILMAAACSSPRHCVHACTVLLSLFFFKLKKRRRASTCWISNTLTTTNEISHVVSHVLGKRVSTKREVVVELATLQRHCDSTRHWWSFAFGIVLKHGRIKQQKRKREAEVILFARADSIKQNHTKSTRNSAFSSLPLFRVTTCLDSENGVTNPIRLDYGSASSILWSSKATSMRTNSKMFLWWFFINNAAMSLMSPWPFYDVNDYEAKYTIWMALSSSKLIAERLCLPHSFFVSSFVENTTKFFSKQPSR